MGKYSTHTKQGIQLYLIRSSSDYLLCDFQECAPIKNMSANVYCYEQQTEHDIPYPCLVTYIGFFTSLLMAVWRVSFELAKDPPRLRMEARGTS